MKFESMIVSRDRKAVAKRVNSPQSWVGQSPMLALLRFVICLLAAALATANARATYTYVDASVANTTLAGQPIVLGTHVTNGIGNGTDGLWSFRTDVSSFENGTYFESDAGSGAGDRESTPELITTIHFPEAGTYEILVVFTSSSGRDIAARIGAGTNSSHIFTIANSVLASGLGWDSSYTNGRPAGAGAGTLGTVTTTVPNQSVAVHVNGFANTAASDDERTQYDGVAFRASAPVEPLPVHRDVFILAGQSNADGRGVSSELTGSLAPYADLHPKAIIHYTNPNYNSADRSHYKKWVPLAPGYSLASGSSGPLPRTTFGPEIGVANILADHFEHPALIKVTQGGTALTNPGSQWYPAPLDSPQAGNLYVALIESTRQALQQLSDTGDTYTVHGLLWHQGESDSGKPTSYANIYPQFVSGVRRDLNLPNLRFIIGQLAPNRDPAFENVQWQLSRTLRNVSFVSSENLTTSDAQTHFDTESMIRFGRRYGMTALRDFTTIDFDGPLFTRWPLDRQFDFSTANPAQPVVVATLSQGAYQGGQAAGHKGASGEYFFNRRGLLPLAGPRMMTAEFLPGDAGYDNDGVANSSLHVHGWREDGNKNGHCEPAESAVGFGLENDGSFVILAGSNIHRSDGVVYQTDRWYRLVLEWSLPDAENKRTVSLRVRDLLTNNDLNGGDPVVEAAVAGVDFGGAPHRWFGIGLKTSRGLLDNISVEPPGFAGWASRFPGLAGGRDGDDDGDGFSNLVEYAMGLDPTRPDPGDALPPPVVDGQNIILSVAPVERLADVIYQADWSVDLENWTTVSGVESAGTIQFTIGRQPEVFLRRRFTVSP